jgi:hypothetical protein
MKRLTISAALLLLATGAHAEPPKGMLHVSPAPGVSFDVPATWIACDDATNKLLGDNADPHGLKAKVCVMNASVPYKFRAFNPNLFHTVSMLLDQHEKLDITADELASITPDVAKAISPASCAEIVKPMTGDGTVIASCEVTVGTFAGMKALHSIVVATPPGNEIAKFQVDIYEMPYSQGYLQVQFNSPMAFRSVTGPEIDSVIASFKIE